MNSPSSVCYFKKFTFSTSFNFTLNTFLHNIWGMMKYCNQALKSCFFFISIFEISQKRQKLFIISAISNFCKKSWNVKKWCSRSNLGSVDIKAPITISYDGAKRTWRVPNSIDIFLGDWHGFSDHYELTIENISFSLKLWWIQVSKFCIHFA